jgi:hypothetical protein
VDILHKELGLMLIQKLLGMLGVYLNDCMVITYIHVVVTDLQIITKQKELELQ